MKAAQKCAGRCAICFGNNETTKTDKTDLPQWLNDAAQSNVSSASNLQNKGFTSYNNPTVASFSPQQTASFGLGTDVANGAAPAIGNTGNWINDYANAGPGSVSPSTIASKMSPYMNQYVMQALAPGLEAQDQQFAGQNKSFDSASTGSGAFGDSSYNLGRTNLTNQQNIGRTGLVADAYQRAFNTAIGAGAQDVSNDINAQTTNANLRETQLGREAAGANAAFGMGVGSTNLTNSLGGQQTAQQQAQLNAQYNEFLRQQYQDPKFRQDAMNSAITAGRAGSDVTTTTTAPNNAGYGLVGSALGAVGTVGGAMLGGPVGAAAGGALGGMIGNSFGSGEAGANGVSMYGPGSEYGYADGGRPPVGRPVLVGERGPEVFHPDSAGAPHHNGLADIFGNWANMIRGGGSQPGGGGRLGPLMPWINAIRGGQTGRAPQQNGQPGGTLPPLPGFGVMGGGGLAGMLNPAMSGGAQPGSLPTPPTMSGGTPNTAQPSTGQPNQSMLHPMGGAGPKLPGFAEGGEYPVDEPFIVGENGPEVIQMDQPGTVIPNEALSGGNNNLEAAHKELKLTPQERALYQRHLDNLNGPGGVDNPDGSRSSLYNVQFTNKANGRDYNVPSVYDGKILEPHEAVDRALNDGIDQFPSYGSSEEADARYQRMHDFMEKDTKAFQERQPAPPMAGGGLADQLGAPAQAPAPGPVAPAPGQAPGAPTDDVAAEPPLFLKSGTAAPPQPPQSAAPPPARSPMRGTAALGNPRGPSPAQQDLTTLQGIADNPGEAVSNFGLTGGIVGNAIKNKSDGAAQPLGSSKPKPAPTGAVPYPNSSSVFDLLGPNTAAAAESHDPRPTMEIPEPTTKEAAEITRINTEMKAAAVKRDKALKASKYRDPNRDPDVIAAQSPISTLQAQLDRIEGPQSPLGARRAAAIEAHKTELTAWTDRQSALITGKTNANLPYAEKYPERQSWLQENMPKISAGTGAAFGLLGKGKLVGPAVKASASGALEGAGTAAWPTLQDTEFLPPGGNWKDAAGRVFNGDESSKDFWKRVGTGAASHALIAGGASGAGSAVRDLGGQMVEGAKHIRWPKPQAAETPPNSVFAPPAGAPAAAATAAPKAAPKTKAEPELVNLPDGSKLTKWDYGDGRVRYHKGSKRISAEEAEALMAPPPRASRARPPIQAVQ